MDIGTWLMAHGETVQYLAFGVCLLAMAAWERLQPARKQDVSRTERWRANFTLTGLNVLALGLLPISFIVAAQWAEGRGLGVLHAYGLPAGVSVALSLLGRGFISWVTHLLMHKVPLLWRVHRVHHTDTELDVSTTVRFHPLEFPIGLVIGLPLVLVMGLSPWVLVAYEVLDVSVTLVSHTNVSLPSPIERWLRYLLVTPDLHRIHHSTDPEETDSNFSAVFPVWDIVFGTFRIHTNAPPTVMPLGLEEVRDARTRTVWWLLSVPFRRDLSSARRDAGDVLRTAERPLA
jgi:sterol desaturase/sphingolipid hydroxylase (fatty acid hydroxylase superfamily)